MTRDRAAATGAPPAPRPKSPPLVGQGPKFVKDLLMAFVDGWRECGDVVFYDVPRPMLALTRPEYVEQVMDKEWKTHRRSDVVRNRLLEILGEAGMNLDPDDWLERHRITGPALEAWKKTGFDRIVARTTDEMLDRWAGHARRGDGFDVQPEMVRLSLDIGGRSLVGADLWDPAAEEVRAAWVGLAEYLIPRVTGFPFRVGKLRPVYRRSRRDLARLNDFLYHAVEVRRREPADDLTSLLVEGRDEETNRGLSDKQVRDELGSRLLGFYKSIPPVMTWTWWLLSSHPEEGDRVRAEVADVVGGRRPAEDDLPKLVHTTRVVHEVLRMYPPIFLMSRPPDQDEVIGGYHIPKDVLVVLNPYINGRHPDFWERPDDFEPGRFDGEPAGERGEFTYFPFGAGPRKCDSEHFGFMALRLVLATVSRRYRLDVPRDHEIKRKSHFILRPSNGLPVNLRPARAA